MFSVWRGVSIKIFLDNLQETTHARTHTHIHNAYSLSFSLSHTHVFLNLSLFRVFISLNKIKFVFLLSPSFVDSWDNIGIHKSHPPIHIYIYFHSLLFSFIEKKVVFLFYWFAIVKAVAVMVVVLILLTASRAQRENII